MVRAEHRRLPREESARTGHPAASARPSLRNRPWFAALLIVPLLVPGEVRGSQAEHPPLLGSTAEIEGDLPLLANGWWRTITEAPDSLRAQVALLLWNARFADAPIPPLSSNDLRSLRGRIRSNGWSHRVAGWKLRRALLREGDRASAQALEMTQGSPRRWLGIGPFGRAEAVELRRDRSPESALKSGRTLRGAGGVVVGWRPLNFAGDTTRLDLASAWERHGAMVYLRSRFAVERDLDGLLQFVCSGSFRVWLDGRLVTRVDRTAAERPGSGVRVGVHLARGPHTLLVQCPPNDFAMLLRRPDGYTIRIDSLDPWSRDVDAASQLVELSPQGLATHDWLRAARAGTLAAESQLLLAEVLATTGEVAPCLEVLAAAERAGAAVVPLALTVERIADHIPDLPPDWRRSWVITHRKSALEDTPNGVPLILARAWSEFTDGRPVPALQSVRSVLDAHPQSLPALLLGEEICADQGWEAARRDMLDRCREVAPDHPAVLRRWLHYELERERTDLARGLREHQFRRRPSLESASQLVRARARSGDREGAIALARQLPEIGEGSSPAQVSRFELLLELGEAAEALSHTAEVLAIDPEGPRFPIEIADVHWRLGHLEDARAGYAEAHHRRRGLSSIRLRTERLSATIAGSEVAAVPAPMRPFRRSTATIVQQATPLHAYPRAEAVYLLDQMITLVHDQGGVDEFTHQILRIESRDAVERYSSWPIVGELLELRVITPDGEELRPTSDEGGGTFTLPGLQPGCIIESRSILRRDLEDWRGVELGPFYFRDPRFLAAYDDTEWVVISAADTPLEVDARNLPAPAEERVDAGRRVWRWRYRAMAPGVPEFSMPPARELVPNVTIRGTENRAVADTVDALIADAARRESLVTPFLREVVRDHAPESGDRWSRALALRAAVVERVKVDGSEDNATAVWLAQSGDRDIALAGLLRAAGIPYHWIYPALADDLDPFRDWSRPHRSYFQRPFLRIVLEGGEERPLSALLRLSAPDRLPYGALGARAVEVDATGARWIRTPDPKAGSEARILRTSISLSRPGGVVQVRGEAEFRMYGGASLKEQLAALPDVQQRRMVEQFARGTFPGATLRTGSFPDLEVVGTPFRMAFTLEAPESAVIESREGVSRLRTVLIPVGLVREFIRERTRQHPYWSKAREHVLEETTVQLGSFELVSTPADCQLEGVWGSFRRTVRAEGTTLLVRRELILEPFLLPAAGYQEWRDFCQAVDLAERERVALRLPHGGGQN